jgi:hypothetical protein
MACVRAQLMVLKWVRRRERARVAVMVSKWAAQWASSRVKLKVIVKVRLKEASWVSVMATW